MTENESTAAVDPAKVDPGITRRELAVAKSLDSARVRAEGRLQRFLDAALELMMEAEPGKEVTVQEVVERSGQSIRLFYQYFGGKHELLLALFEETVRTSTDTLRRQIAEATDPLERLHRFVVEYYRTCRPVADGETTTQMTSAWMMVDFAQQLLTSYPAEAAQAFAPLVALFGELLDEAADSGAIRPGLRRSAVAGTMLESIMFNTFAATIGGTPVRPEGTDPAEELWDLILHGVGLPGSA